MNALDGVIDDLNTSTFAFIEDNTKTCNELWEKINQYIKNIELAVEIYKTTGIAPGCNSEDWDTFEVLKNTHQRNSLKENIQPDENVPNEVSSIKNRPRRNAFKEAAENINKQSNMSLTTKLRRPDADGFQNVCIKKEKVSISNSETASDTSEIKVKTENEEMPAPTRTAPKRKKQKKTENKSLVKTEKIEEGVTKQIAESNDQDSDAMEGIQKRMVNLLSINDNNSDKTIKIEDTVENVDGKMKEKVKGGKRTRTLSPDEESPQKMEKRTKSQSDNLKIGDSTTEINDEVAGSTIGNKNNTYTSKFLSNMNLETPPTTMNASTTMNATVVIENPKYVVNHNMETPVTTTLTNDELNKEKKQKNQKTVSKTITKSSKQIFSPFEPSPVKKKIQAFEKLKQESNGIPVRVTRARADAKEQERVDSQAVKIKGNVKEKVKMFTPDKSKFIPSAASTTLKVNRLISKSSSNESLLTKSLKVSQAELRKREEERREKNQEISKKREALMQAQKEEKRRKREEKQLKAQQQRQALEKEKMKILEIQRLKDERHKQLLAEQEQRKQKQKEELERKRMKAKMKAIEEKQKEEVQRLEEQRKAEEMSTKLAKQDEELTKLVQKQKTQREQKQQLPIYLRTKAPVLPTDDCYDSDDEEFKQTHFKEPTWARGSSLRDIQFCIITAGEAIKNSFFSRQAQTPDLQDIFEVIHSEKLKRSSSAMWHKPPRYTMMPILDGHLEDDED